MNKEAEKLREMIREACGSDPWVAHAYLSALDEALQKAYDNGYKSACKYVVSKMKKQQ